MKKLLSIAVAAFATAALAETVPCADVGVTAITTSLKNTIVAVPFESLRNLESGKISVKDIVKTTNLDDGTMLYVFNGSSYSAWSIESGAWEPATVVSDVDGMTIGMGAADATISTGSAIWICRNSTAEVTFYVYGKYVAPSAVTLASGRNLVANLSQESKAPAITGVSAGDMILAPNGDYYTYSAKKGSWNSVDGGGNIKSGLPTIAAGQGFWYIAKNSGTIINW